MSTRIGTAGLRRSLELGTFLVAAGLGVGCGGTPRSAPSATASTPESTPADSDPDARNARLQRERDDAEHRAMDAQRIARDAQGGCQLTQHELEALRERVSYEEGIWSRLGHADISEGALREKLAGAPRARRASLESVLKDVGVARASVEHELRRVHSVSDVEWARYTHDLESTLDGLERMLRDVP